MAAPNLLSPTTINGKTTYLTLSTTNETNLLVNAASSGKAIKVISVYVANIDGTISSEISLSIYSSATAGTEYMIANTIVIPADATVILIGRDAPIWLEEDKRLVVQASSASDLSVVCSYEEVS